MDTHYPPLRRNSVEAGIPKAEEAKGGAEGSFAEKGSAEGLVEGRILEGVAEEGININKGLEKRHCKIGEEGGVTLSVVPGVVEGVVEAPGVAEVVIEEDAVENVEGGAEVKVDNGEDTHGNEEGDVENDESDEEEGEAEEGDGLVVAGESGNATEDGADLTGEERLDAAEAIKEGGVAEGGVAEGGVREEGIVEGVITEVGIAHGIAEKGVAEGMEEWDIREGAAEESIAAESIAEGGRVEEGMALVWEEIVGEKIENCLHKLSPGRLGVTQIATDMSHGHNALLVACITHTHKN